MSDFLHVVKIGGNVIDDEQQLNKFLECFCSLNGPKLLVHGGGIALSRMAKRLGIKVRMIDGRRITSEEDLDLAKMIYRGKINIDIVNMVNAFGQKSIGLSGVDGNIIEAVKRPVKNIDYGLVGDIVKVNPQLLLEMLYHWSVVPVVCALAHDNKGQVLNINADTIASSIASSIASLENAKPKKSKKKINLIFSFEKDGVLYDPDDDSSVVPKMDNNKFQKLQKKGTLSKGILPKLHNAFEALEKGVDQVIICNLLNYVDSKKGTIITL